MQMTSRDASHVQWINQSMIWWSWNARNVDWVSLRTLQTLVSAFLVLRRNRCSISRSRYVRHAQGKQSSIQWRGLRASPVRMIILTSTLRAQDVSNAPKANTSIIPTSHNVSHVRNKPLTTTALWTSARSAHGMPGTTIKPWNARISVYPPKSTSNLRILVLTSRIHVKMMRFTHRGKTSAYPKTPPAPMTSSTTNPKPSASRTRHCAN